MKKQGSQKRKKRLLAICGSLLIVLAICILLYSSLFSEQPILGFHIPNPLYTPVAVTASDRLPDVTYTLLAGTHEDGALTDTIMLIRFDAKSKDLCILSVPRDTIVNTDRKAKRINAAYAVGGMDQLKADVLSVTGILADRTVLVDLEGTAALIDKVGGIWYTVPEDMYWNDPTQDLLIDLKKGYQRLDGENAVKFLRCRNIYAEADIGRTRAQQDFLKEALKQVLQPKNLLQVPALSAMVQETVESDYSLGELIYYGKALLNMPDDAKENVFSATLPGKELRMGASFWQLDEGKLLELLNDERVNPYTREITAADLDLYK